jgi:hypothetical protein
LEKAIEAQKQMLVVAASSRKPDDGGIKAFEPTAKLIEQIISIRDKNRASKQFNHLSTLSEGITALAWVTIVSLNTFFFIFMGKKSFSILKENLHFFPPLLPSPFLLLSQNLNHLVSYSWTSC